MADVELRRILRLVAARSLNTFGRQVLNATVLWELYERTSSKLVLSAVGLAQVVPVVLLFVPAGTLVDRSDRRSLSAAAAGVTGVIGLALALLSGLDAPIELYFVLLAGQGCATAIHAPAVASLVPLIIARGELTRANRISASLQELSAIIGPALAGLALKFVAASWVYAAIAITGLSAGVLYRSLPRPRVVEPGAASARKDWRVGLRFIFASPLLLPALTLDMFAVLFAGVTALLPAVASDVLHVDALGYGLLRAAQSAGAVMMALIGGRIAPWRRPGRVLLIVVALFGLATVGFGLSTWFPLSLALLFLCGALDNVSVVIRLTLEQLVVPDAIRGRVSAVHFVFIGMSNELGAAESGLAAAMLGTVPSIIVGGALAVIVVGVVALRWRELARMPPLSELQPG
ncbi:MAG: MFS transporter [Deltaproteobacteria bacterium]|nr:MAG: MFS transporter [Deltaproteobacteria bacterium]TMQ23977.1 MAG: MFS transporter [Deltaproteobacteria bacterium]